MPEYSGEVSGLCLTKCLSCIMIDYAFNDKR